MSGARRQLRATGSAGLIVTAIVALLAGVRWNPSTLAAASTRVVPRTPDGTPDFQGVWHFASLTPLERAPQFGDRPFLTAAEADAYERELRTRANTDRRDPSPAVDLDMEVNDFWWEKQMSLAQWNGRRMSSFVIDPPDGRIPPLTDEARARAEARAARYTAAENPEDRELSDRCLGLAGPPFLPGEIDGAFLQIVQTRRDVVLHTETSNTARIVPIAPAERPSFPVPRWSGNSVAHWEGDELVIETTGVREGYRIRSTHTDGGLRLTERFSFASSDAVVYKATVADATVFTRPWTVVVPMVRTSAPIYEFACHEGNVALAHILRGARAAERRDLR